MCRAHCQLVVVFVCGVSYFSALNFLRMLVNDFVGGAFKTRFRCSGSPMQKRLIGMSQACLTYHRSTPVWFIWTLWHFEKIRFLHFFPWKKIRSFLAKLFFKNWSIKKANSVVVFSSWLSLWILGLNLRENVRWIAWVSYFSKKNFLWYPETSASLEYSTKLWNDFFQILFLMWLVFNAVLS